MLGYIDKKDKSGQVQLYLSGQCVILAAGVTVPVIKEGFRAVAIRYQGMKLYTVLPFRSS